MVGLHFGGPVNPQPGDVNLGSRVATLAESSPIIRQLVRRPEPEEPVVVDSADSLPQSPELVFWETIRDSDDQQMFQAYLDRYPEGEFAVLAEIKLAALAPVPDPGPPPAPKIQIEPLSQQMVATSDANVRAGPATDAQRLGLIRREQTVEVTGRVRDADWYLISYAGNDAFVYAPLLKTPDQTTPAAPPPPDFKPDYGAGAAAYEAGAYASALRHFVPLAQNNNAAAQFNLGLMYVSGKGVPQDYVAAVEWYRRAADQGHADAQNHLGRMYEKNLGMPQVATPAPLPGMKSASKEAQIAVYRAKIARYLAAVEWYRRAADQGHALAQTNLRSMCTSAVVSSNTSLCCKYSRCR